jgi:hypothetical protein
MKNLAGNRLYAWDHNTDYVSTFQNQTSKKRRRRKKKKKRENKENLLRSSLYMHISKEKSSSAIDHSFQGSILTRGDTSKMTRCYIRKPFLSMVNEKSCW